MRGINELSRVEKEAEKQTSGTTLEQMIKEIYSMLVAQEPTETETETTETETETETEELNED